MKTAELTGAALDWAVAKCVYNEIKTRNGQPFFILDNARRVFHHTHENGWRDSQMEWYQPSANWAQGGPIIERERISIISDYHEIKEGWMAESYDSTVHVFGTTPLEAAMRCYVASKLGDTVDIPKELHP